MLNFRNLVLFFLVSMVLACSPKLNKPSTAPVIPAPKPEVKKDNPKPVEKFTEANISLLIPFKLDQLHLTTATKAQLERADMAIDFYQGVKMGFDSATSLGMNFRLQVFDSRDNQSHLVNLTKKPEIKQSQLIIGPVFPDGISALTQYSISNDLPIVSPLAASKPSEFNNPKLISIVNHIDQHSVKLANYIGAKFAPTNSIVVMINPKRTADEEFALPMRQWFKQKFPTLTVQEFSSAAVFETKMVKGKKYAVVVCSSESSFVNATLDKLAKIGKLRANDYQFFVFGHPNWIKQNYNIDNLQYLQTVISTSYWVDYKSPSTIDFIKKYRSEFNFEPSEFAFKGFDIGFYFGKLLAKHGKKYLDFITKEKYHGLQNRFDFGYDPKFGYFNKELQLLQYRNLALMPLNY